jgi:DNA-directed RNA polymerase III subunit RPC8
LTVFRPFPTEIILAKVKSSDEDGIQRGLHLPTQCVQVRSQPRLTRRTLLVSVGFFEDMWIPLVYLPQPCALYVILLYFPNTSIIPLQLSVWFALYSDPNERAYFWLPSSEATSTHELLDSPEAERLYIDQGEIVRVRVERDEFCDDEPGPPKATEGVLISGQGQARRLPYTVTVSPQISSTASARSNT